MRFEPDERVEVRECRSNLTTCSVFSQTPSATATGAFSTRYTVSRTVALQTCGASGCVIRVHRANGTNLAVPLRFG